MTDMSIMQFKNICQWFLLSFSLHEDKQKLWHSDTFVHQSNSARSPLPPLVPARGHWSVRPNNWDFISLLKGSKSQFDATVYKLFYLRRLEFLNIWKEMHKVSSMKTISVSYIYTVIYFQEIQYSTYRIMKLLLHIPRHIFGINTTWKHWQIINLITGTIFINVIA